MKSKFFKIGMPMMVFMMAIAFAFATEKTADKSEALVQGYIFKDGICQAARSCDNSGGPLCQEDGLTVHLVNEGDTFCSIPMTQWP